MIGLQRTAFGDTYRVLSYGGGVDSMGMLVLAIEKGELPDLVIFADVGDVDGLDPAEWPSTYRHIREVVMPLCAKHGIEFKWLDTVESPIRGERSLFQYFAVKHTMPGRLSRLCTSAAKVERIANFLAEHVASSVTHLEVQIGFEAGEELRAARDPHSAGKATTRRVNRFPLMEAGLCRCRTIDLIKQSGFEVPNGSACTFCPFSKWDDFKRLSEQLPETFAQTQKLEDDCKRTKKGLVMRYDYMKGDGSDRRLTDRVRLPYARQVKACAVCGRTEKAQKKTSCEPISQFPVVS